MPVCGRGFIVDRHQQKGKKPMTIDSKPNPAIITRSIPRDQIMHAAVLGFVFAPGSSYYGGRHLFTPHRSPYLFDKEVREGFASWFVLVYGAHVLCTVAVNGCLYYGILAYFDLTA